MVNAAHSKPTMATRILRVHSIVLGKRLLKDRGPILQMHPAPLDQVESSGQLSLGEDSDYYGKKQWTMSSAEQEHWTLPKKVENQFNEPTKTIMK